MIRAQPLSLAMKLKNIVDICEAADAAIDEQNLIKKGALDAGKENDGIEPAVVRKILARRKKIAKDPAETTRLEDLMTDYQFMLGEGREDARPWTQTDDEISRVMALTNTTKPPKIEAIKKALGCSQGKAHKLRSIVAVRLAKKSSSSSTPREHEHLSAQDPATGEVIETLEADEASAVPEAIDQPLQAAPPATQTADLDTLPGDGEASAERDASASSSPPESCGSTEGRAGQLLAPEDESARCEQSGADETLKDRKAAGTPEMAASRPAGVESGPQDTAKSLSQRITGTFDDIAGPMPEKLRRAPATVQP